MKRLGLVRPLALILSALLVACAGAPVKFQTVAPASLKSYTGSKQLLTAEACGFQLFLFIPIGVNSRLERAYASLLAQAAGAPLTDVEVKEAWTYGFIGTNYCTTLQAQALVTGT
jgi:hypothetical protein